MLVLKTRKDVTVVHPINKKEYDIMMDNFDDAGVRWNSGDRASGTYNYNPTDYFCLTYRGDRCNYALTYCSRTYHAINVVHRKLTDIIVDNRLEAN